MNKKSELLLVLEEIREYLIKLEEEGLDIVAIEIASYLPIKTNAELDNSELNVVYIENPKTYRKKMN